MATRSRARLAEVVAVFARLGVTSFGGPIAHLGYFRAAVVDRRAWVTDAQYGQLVALSQALPGPASSQVGFGLGMVRAGLWGAFAAFLAFTAPSAILMTAFGLFGVDGLGPLGEGMVRGLKIVAVAVVAQALLGMIRSLTPDARRASIAALAALLALTVPGSLGQIAAITLGVVAGLLFCRSASAATPSAPVSLPVPRAAGITCLTLFFALLLGLPALARMTGDGTVTLIETMYRSGALVFGGGHVVLPLLEAGMVDPGWVSGDQFFAGYGLAQAMPGPLFTFAPYLGAVADIGPGGLLGAVIALIAIFLPGFLLLAGVAPFWNSLNARVWMRAVLPGVNAAVVGILGAAFYDPLWTTAVGGATDFALALVCFVLLVAWRTPPVAVVLIGAAGGALLGLL